MSGNPAPPAPPTARVGHKHVCRAPAPTWKSLCTCSRTLSTCRHMACPGHMTCRSANHPSFTRASGRRGAGPPSWPAVGAEAAAAHARLCVLAGFLPDDVVPRPVPASSTRPIGLPGAAINCTKGRRAEHKARRQLERWRRGETCRWGSRRRVRQSGTGREGEGVAQRGGSVEWHKRSTTARPRSRVVLPPAQRRRRGTRGAKREKAGISAEKKGGPRICGARKLSAHPPHTPRSTCFAPPPLCLHLVALYPYAGAVV